MCSLNFPEIDFSLPTMNKVLEEAKESGNQLIDIIEEYWLNRYLLRKCYRCYDFDKNLDLRKHFRGDLKVKRYITKAFDTNFNIDNKIREIKKAANSEEFKKKAKNKKINKSELFIFLDRMQKKIDELRKNVIKQYLFFLSFYEKILYTWSFEILKQKGYSERKLKDVLQNCSGLNNVERSVLCEYYLFKKNSNIQSLNAMKSILWIKENGNIPDNNILQTKKRFFNYVAFEFNMHGEHLKLSKQAIKNILDYDDMKSVSNFITSLKKKSNMIILENNPGKRNLLYEFIYYDPTVFSPIKLFTRTERFRLIIDMKKLFEESPLKRHSFFLIHSIIETNKFIKGKNQIQRKDICNIVNVKKTVYDKYQTATYRTKS